MATFVFPPIPPDELKKREDENIASELEWLLESLQSSFVSLKEGLEECVALLAPKEPGSTLVLSSHRSEHVKGFVTRIGTKIVKGDISLRLQTLPTPKTLPSFPAYRFQFSSEPTIPYLVLSQLIAVRTSINNSLDIIDVSRWTGQSNDAHFISGQLRLLNENISEARLSLKGESEHAGERWNEGGSVDDDIFHPPLPPSLSLQFSISDAALVLTTRTLQSVANSSSHSPGTSTPTTADTASLSLSGFSIRERLFGLGPKLPTHDEMGETFHYKGGEVEVKEKHRVESMDPSLIAIMTKLTALEHEVGRLREALRILMGEEDDDE